MKTITIPKALTSGRYSEHVLEDGHIPGVLSGAELKGKARHYSGWYFRKRCQIVEAVKAYGVVKAAFRGRKEPVRLTIV